MSKSAGYWQQLNNQQMKTRKEYKEEYLKMKFKMGVFQLKNKENGKVFIGSSPDLIANWNSLRFQLEMGSYPNTDLQSDWKKFGSNSFEYSIIDEIAQPDDDIEKYKKEMKALEIMIIEDIQPFGVKGYNKPAKNKL